MTCSSRHPSRAAANWKVEDAGCAVHSPSRNCSARVPPTPCQNGSPEASTTVGRPRQAITHAVSNGTGQAWPRSPIPASARCRSPPNTVSAEASAFRLASESPARPSSPMPMILSQELSTGSTTMRALILGGTSDANRLADAAARLGVEAIYSYAGRTEAPATQALPTRVGGFGGASGLADYIRHEKITHIVDATHPFAAEMSRNAVAACALTGAALIALERAPWTKTPGDSWIEVGDVTAAAAALPERRISVFLAIGRQHLAPFAAKPQHAYTLRFVDPPEGPLPLPETELIVSRGPFTLEGDLELMCRRNVAWVVARNSGGAGARAKIDAARALGLPVIMIARPALPERPRVGSVDEVLAWLGHDARLGA